MASQDSSPISTDPKVVQEILRYFKYPVMVGSQQQGMTRERYSEIGSEKETQRTAKKKMAPKETKERERIVTSLGEIYPSTTLREQVEAIKDEIYKIDYYYRQEFEAIIKSIFLNANFIRFIRQISPEQVREEYHSWMVKYINYSESVIEESLKLTKPGRHLEYPADWYKVNNSTHPTAKSSVRIWTSQDNTITYNYVIYEAICSFMNWFLEEKIGDKFGHDLTKIPVDDDSTNSVEDVLRNLQLKTKPSSTGEPGERFLANKLVSDTPMRHQWDFHITGKGQCDLTGKKYKPPKGKEALLGYDQLKSEDSTAIPIKTRHWRDKLNKDARVGRISAASGRLTSEVYCYQLVSWVQDPSRSCSEYIEGFLENSHDTTDGRLCTGESLENRCVFGYLGSELMMKIGIHQPNITVFPTRTALASSQKRDALEQTHRAIQFLKQTPIDFVPPDSSNVFEYFQQLEEQQDIGILTLITCKDSAPQHDIRSHTRTFDKYCFVYLIYETVGGKSIITSVEPVIFFSITESDVLHDLPKDHPILGYYQQDSEPLPITVLGTDDDPSKSSVTGDAKPESESETDSKLEQVDPSTPSRPTDTSGFPQQKMIQYNPYDINQQLPTVEVTGTGMVPTQYLMGNEYKSYRNLYEPEVPHHLVGRIVTNMGEERGPQSVKIEWTS
jgi:hypothetical protein